MKINILDYNKLIDLNHIEEVSSPRLFSNKMIFDSEGILSTDIFGVSKDDRRSTFAYINLKQKFIHPHLYAKVLKGGIFRNIMYLVSGQRRFIVRDGKLLEDSDNGWTGLANLYDHWDEIDWHKTSTSTNKNDKDLMKSLTKDQVFIDKFIIIPPAYRDVMLSGTVDSSDHVNELNDLYVKLIRSCSRLNEGGLFARQQYASQAIVQNLLVDIMNYFKQQIAKKQGLIRKNLIGKKVDFGVRAVISANAYTNDKFEDCIVDLEHTAVPISMCCSMFYPFIEAWLKNFFRNEVINNPNLAVFYDSDLKKEITGAIKDPEAQFSDKNIKKMINNYCLNPDTRFKPLQIQIVIPKKDKDEIKTLNMMLKGKSILPNNATKELDRPMTVTDILYLASVDVCEKRHVMVSRYPVGTDKGIFLSKIRVQSTVKHIKLIFNGKEYPFYPDINMKIDPNQVGIQFIDTLVMSNSHCDGMGADYDGDTLSARGIYSDEANDECEEIMNKKMSALNITGNNSKVVSKEVFQSLYELTKECPSNMQTKDVKPVDVDRFLKMSVEDITKSFLVSIFADTVDDSDNKNNTKARKSSYNTWDKMSIPKDHFFKGQPQINSTIGRYFVNKFILFGSGCISATGYMNNVMTKGSIGDLDNVIGRLYMEDKINRKSFNGYTDRRDCLGYWVNGFLAHTISEKMTKPLPAIEKRKAELYKKYEKEISEGNIDVMTQISNELVDLAKKELKDDPGMDLYDSGDLDFKNNYKNNSILKGPVKNNITNEFDFIGSSFMDGIEIKDLPAHANSILSAQYPASIATQDAGYMGKKLLALLQMMQIDEPGTDCHTKNLIPITITKTNKKMMYYTYIEDGNSEVMLTEDNIGSYLGKTVKMRTPMSCTHEKICSKCAGQLFYNLGVQNAGLFAVQISHASLNLGLKAKHDQTVSLYSLNPETIIKDI